MFTILNEAVTLEDSRRQEMKKAPVETHEQRKKASPQRSLEAILRQRPGVRRRPLLRRQEGRFVEILSPQRRRPRAREIRRRQDDGGLAFSSPERHALGGGPFQGQPSARPLEALQERRIARG